MCLRFEEFDLPVGFRRWGGRGRWRRRHGHLDTWRGVEDSDQVGDERACGHDQACSGNYQAQRGDEVGLLLTQV